MNAVYEKANADQLNRARQAQTAREAAVVDPERYAPGADDLLLDDDRRKDGENARMP